MVRRDRIRTWSQAARPRVEGVVPLSLTKEGGRCSFGWFEGLSLDIESRAIVALLLSDWTVLIAHLKAVVWFFRLFVARLRVN